MSTHKRSITRSDEPREKKIFFELKRFVLIVFLVLIISYLHPIKPVFSETRYVPSQYPTIQAAVYSAVAGDTIQVAPGIYYEHIFVNISLTVLGADPQTTIVDGTGNGTVFTLDGSNIYISGFTIRNAGTNNSAIASLKETATSDHHMIRNNIITTNGNGVYLSYSNYDTIFNNTFINNIFGGVVLASAGNTNITANTIIEGPYGIKAQLSTNNIIIGNTISQTSYAIYLSSASSGNTIRSNVLSGKTACVYSNSDNTIIDHNTLIDGASGIYLYNCESASVYYNICRNSSYGIRLYCLSSTGTSHTISNNKILYTDWAIEIVYSDGNTLTGNWLQQNTYGIYIGTGNSNTIYRNNFVNNSMQAYSGIGTGNTWNKNIQGKNQGNYWSDYTGADADGNGIGDTPYRIAPIGADNYPLMTTWSEHDIEIKGVTPSTNEANSGATINITVTVYNRANTSTSETFTVTAKYNSTIIGTKAVSNLAQGATQILIFNWNTTGVALGNYTISAVASVVSDELNTDNNSFTDGAVKIEMIGDCDGDGDVDYNDFIVLAGAYGSAVGQPAYKPEADFDGDGDVDYNDFIKLAGNYGKSVPP